MFYLTFPLARQGRSPRIFFSNPTFLGPPSVIQSLLKSAQLMQQPLTVFQMCHGRDPKPLPLSSSKKISSLSSLCPSKPYSYFTTLSFYPEHLWQLQSKTLDHQLQSLLAANTHLHRTRLSMSHYSKDERSLKLDLNSLFRIGLDPR